jgi:hypothetical protein
MADGRDEATAFSFRKTFPWTEIFRCFQVALDPRKLLVAAGGIVVMSLGWWFLSWAFYRSEPAPNAPQYTDVRALQREFGQKPDKTDYTTEELQQKGQEKFRRDLAEWRVLDELAGPEGRLRTLPWNEFRGPNPYLYATQLAGSPSATWMNSIWRYVTDQTPVLAEPLVKFLLPVIRLFDPNASTLTRLYLLLVILWSVATWAFFGGVITRIAVVQLSGKDRISLKEAVRYVANRYVSYVLSPLFPLGIVAAVVIGLAIYGFIALLPIFGDVVLYGLGFPLVVLGGIVMTFVLIGLVAYPLMYTTLSTEGSDTFDAVSRAYSYLLQAPAHYLWYAFIAVLYGVVVTFLVVLVASLMVYLGKWAIIQAPLSETTNQRPDYLFIYAPKSFGWRELLLQGSPLEVRRETTPTDAGRVIVTYPFADPDQAERYIASYQPWNWLGVWLVTFWLVLVFLLMLGFSYSFFWSAMTMIYLLMRRKVDEIELDEVYLEEDNLEGPPPAPVGTTGKDKNTGGPGVAALPMVPPPPPVSPPIMPPAPPVQTTTGSVGTHGTATTATPPPPPPAPPPTANLGVVPNTLGTNNDPDTTAARDRDEREPGTDVTTDSDKK